MVFELDWLKRWNQFSKNAVALKDGDTGSEVTYGELYRSACAGAEALASRFGIGRGDRIALLAANELETISLFFAAQRLGAILVPINFRLTAREVEHIVGDCQPKLLIYQKEFSSLLESLSPAVRPAEMIPFFGAGSLAEILATPSSGESFFKATPDDPTMIIYTSGTTGSPKGAVLTHKMMFWNSVNTSLRLNISQSDSAVIFLPLFHTGGWHVLTTPFLHRGARLIFLKKFDGEQILKLTASEKCSLMFGVPTTMEMMARSPLFNDVNLKSLRYAIVGGEPMPLEAIKTWHSKGIAIRQGYGLTEFGPNVFSLGEEDAIRKIGSIGFPNFYIDAKVIDETGATLGANEVGELALRGPMAMQGYWKNEKATLETMQDGWLMTGDLVRRDEEGYYYVVGRKKDMFKSGGENVYPAELEQVLRACRGIREAAVIGVPDEKWGEVGKAFLVSEGSIDESTVKDHCSKNLAKFKIPKHFVFLAELPKGDSGKILKKALRDLN